MYALPHCQDAFMFLFTNLEWKMQFFLCSGTERVIAVSEAVSGLALGPWRQPRRLGLSFGFMVIDLD